ncbi:MAG: cadherin repeat domain-containing protein, partial [Bacteroidales bacterium]|nr:cadherin repeat domain-containing protein [Bacteroidales bacterium]
TNLVVTERGLGTAEITVTASDGELSVSDRFSVVVNNVNDAPVVVSPISSISRNEGFGTENINLGPVFTDPDGDAMKYSAVSSNTNVVTVSISGTTLTVREAGLGLSTITVTASDGSLSTDDQFTFTINNVNDAPEVVQPIGNRSYEEDFASVTISLSTRFSDPDGDVLTFKAVSSNTGVVTVSVSGSLLTIREVGLGTSNITVTATDNGDGNLSVSDLFTVTVLNVNDAPQLAEPVPNQVVDEHFGTLDINLSGTFSDPDNDALTITAQSSNTGVVTVSMQGSVLRITERGNGLSVITLTASDGELSVSS